MTLVIKKEWRTSFFDRFDGLVQCGYFLFCKGMGFWWVEGDFLRHDICSVFTISCRRIFLSRHACLRLQQWTSMAAPRGHRPLVGRREDLNNGRRFPFSSFSAWRQPAWKAWRSPDLWRRACMRWRSSWDNDILLVEEKNLWGAGQMTTSPRQRAFPP